MRIFAFALAMFACLTNVSHARGVPAWGIAELFRKSDLVVVAAPVRTKATPDRNDALIQPMDIGDVTVVTTTFKIIGFLKSNVDTRQINIEHYALTEQGRRVGNGPSLPDFSKYLAPPDEIDNGEFSKATCMLFLKRGEGGRYTFVTGQYDSVYSVKLIRQFPDAH